MYRSAYHIGIWNCIHICYVGHYIIHILYGIVCSETIYGQYVDSIWNSIVANMGQYMRQ
jgi:hypothetical protein